MSDLNTEVIAEFRANGGVVRDAGGGHFKAARLLLLHHVGRRSGRTYVNPLLYMEHGDSRLLVGSNGLNPPEEPQWVANVEAASEVTVEIGDRTLTVKPTVLRSGPERNQLYTALVSFWPDLLTYQKYTDRTFPVIRLDAA